MSDQQSPVAPKSSKSEAVEESSSKAEPSTVEDGIQFWKEIQAQTGFNSYQTYVNTYADREIRSDLRLLAYWLDQKSEVGVINTCTIIDVLAHEDSPPEISKRCQSESGFEMLAALRQPPKHACVQVVIWEMDTHRSSIRISQEFINTLGLGLRIDPHFVLTLIDTLGVELQRQGSIDAVVETRPLRPSHVVIGRAVATFVRQYPLDKPAATPIILITGEMNWQETKGEEQLRDFLCVADQTINKPPPFLYPSDRVELFSAFKHEAIDQEWLRIYGGTFCALAPNNRGSTSCTTAIIAVVLMPLLQIHCYKIRAQFFRLRRSFLVLEAAMDGERGDYQDVNDTSSKVHRERFRLRRSVEDSDNDMSHFERHISAEDANYFLKTRHTLS